MAVALLCADTALAQLGPGDIVVVDTSLEAALGIDVTTIDRQIISSSAVGIGTNFVLPQGITTDANGDILVADAGVPALFQVDPATGDRAVLSSSNVGTGPNFVTPQGVTTDVNGNILVADAGVPALFRVDPATGDRTILSSSTVGTGPNFVAPTGVTIDANGNILLADAGVPALFQTDPTTGDRVIISQGGTGSVGTGTNFVTPQGIATDGSGDIIVADAGIPALLRVDPMTGNRAILSSAGVGTGTNFITAQDITVDASGFLLVADTGVPAVFRVNPASGNRMTVSSASVGTGPNFVTPQGITTEANGDILIVDAGIRAVMRVNPAAGTQPVISAASDSPVGPVGTGPKLRNPRGVGIDSNADILIAEKQLRAVIRVDPATGNRTVRSAGANSPVGPVGSGPDFSFPWSVALDSNGDILVADSQARAVIRVDRLTANRAVFSAGTNSAVGLVGTGPDFGNPRGLALLADGSILVADAASAAVFQVDPTTGDRSVLSSSAVGAGPNFAFPWGIVLESDGNVLVVDKDLEAVVRVDPVTGDRVIVSKGPIGGGPNLDFPQDITVDSQGDILVVDSSLFSLFRIDPITGARSIVSQFLAGEITGSPRSITAVPELILSPSILVFAGTAQGGTIELTFGFLILRVVTGVGQSAAEIAAAIAQAINNHGTLSAAGITATVRGNQVTTNGLITSTTINDAGITHGTMDIPTLSTQGLALFMLLITATYLSRKTRLLASRF